jgi:chloramphenicol 3-O-phosphotransferase
VVCETIVYDAGDWAGWARALDGVRTHWVRLTAPLAVLRARETDDESRVFKGLAQGMMARPAVGRYELEADTSVESVPAIVQRVVKVIDSP